VKTVIKFQVRRKVGNFLIRFTSKHLFHLDDDDDDDNIGTGIVQWYSAGLRAWKSGVRFPAGLGIFFHHRVQNGSGAQPASYPMVTRGTFSGGKAAGA
jgi:hypothetical protein